MCNWNGDLRISGGSSRGNGEDKSRSVRLSKAIYKRGRLLTVWDWQLGQETYTRFMGVRENRSIIR